MENWLLQCLGLFGLILNSTIDRYLIVSEKSIQWLKLLIYTHTFTYFFPSEFAHGCYNAIQTMHGCTAYTQKIMQTTAEMCVINKHIQLHSHHKQMLSHKNDYKTHIVIFCALYLADKTKNHRKYTKESQ